MSTDKVDAREAWHQDAVILAGEIVKGRALCLPNDEVRAAIKAFESHLRTTPEGYQLLCNSTHEERSWPEDFSYENGNYFSTCCECGRQFTGHKRRIVCKVCANENPIIDAAQEGK